MKNNELERKLECAEFYAKSLEHKIEILEPKAEAYDRLMSGGKKTLKEWANILGMIITFNPRSEDNTNVFTEKPYLYYPSDYAEKINRPSYWTSNGVEYYIPEELIDYSGDWKGSLTLPDGWEDK